MTEQLAPKPMRVLREDVGPAQWSLHRLAQRATLEPPMRCLQG